MRHTFAERLDHRHPARRRRGTGGIECVEQHKPVCANRQGQRPTLLLALGQPVVLNAVRVALKPHRLRDPAQPLGRHRGQVVEGGAERLGDQLKEMQVAYGGQDIGAVGPLLPPRLEQAALPEPLQHRVEQQVPGLAIDEAGPELGQDAEMKAWVGELEAERVFPVDPRPHGLGCLPVAQLLQEL